MYIHTIDKQAGLKKGISFILIALIMTLGFPFFAFSTSNSESTTEKSSREETSSIQADKKEGAIGTVKDSSFDGSNEHFAIIEEFKIDKGFWFTLFGISELARKNEGNKQTAFNFTPIGFSFTGSGFSPTYTQINNGVNISSIIRDNLTGKLSLPGGKSILIEGLTQTSGGASGNNEIRQGEWEENINISVKEYTGISSFEVPVSFKTEPINTEKSLFRISFESESFVYSLKSNSSIRQKFKGFTIVGADDNMVYFSAFRYEGDCFQYENGSQTDHFVGQQIGYSANPENGKALLNSFDIGGFDSLLAGYSRINPTSGSFTGKESSPPEWMGKVLGMSRLFQVNSMVKAEKRTDFIPMATGLGGHVIDGLWSMAFNTSSFLRDIASGSQADAQISEVKNRLFDSNASFIRNLYDPEKPIKGWTGIGPKVEIFDSSNFESYSKIGGDISGLPGNLLVVNKNKWEILKQTSQGKYPGIEESSLSIAANLEQVSQKCIWGKNSFDRISLFSNGYGKIKYKSQGVDGFAIVKPTPVKKIETISTNIDKSVALIEKYITIQTVEYSGKEKQYRTRAINATALEKKVNNEKKFTDYKLWTMEKVMEPTMENSKFLYGPIEFRRKLENEIVSFKTSGFSLIEQVLNHTINQVKKDNPRKDSWKDKINLDFVGENLPQHIEFNFFSRVTALGKNNPGLVIKYVSEPFSFKSLENNFPLVKARSIGIFVYSFEKDQIYQHTSTFEAYCMDESLIIEEFGYLSDQNARPISTLLDVRQEFILQKEPLIVDNPGKLPIWALQGIMAKQIAFTAGIGAGEKRTNPAGPISIINYLSSGKSFDEAWHELLNDLKSNKTLDGINKAYKKFFDWSKEKNRRLKEDYEKNKWIFDIMGELVNEARDEAIVEVALLINPLLGIAIDIYFKTETIYKFLELYSATTEIIVYEILSIITPINHSPIGQSSPITEPITPPANPVKIGASPGKGILGTTALIAAGTAGVVGGGYLIAKALLGTFSMTLINDCHDSKGDIVSFKINDSEYISPNILRVDERIQIDGIPKNLSGKYQFYVKTSCGETLNFSAIAEHYPFKIIIQQDSVLYNGHWVELCSFGYLSDYY